MNLNKKNYLLAFMCLWPMSLLVLFIIAGLIFEIFHYVKYDSMEESRVIERANKYTATYVQDSCGFNPYHTKVTDLSLDEQAAFAFVSFTDASNHLDHIALEIRPALGFLWFEIEVIDVIGASKCKEVKHAYTN